MTASRTSGRIAGLDQLRGTIMVLMALDHASFFIARQHSREFWGTSLPDYASALPFLLRSITHICAPGFFLLMGAGMAMLAAARSAAGWSPWRLRRFFIMRGLLLIAVQVLIENPAWGLAFVRGLPETFVSRGGPIPGHGNGAAIYLGVLFALGAVMILWSLALRLPSWLVGCISAAAILVTQWVTPGPEAFRVDYPWWVRMLQIPGRSGPWVVFYPVLPWLGIAGLGIVLGRWRGLILEQQPRRVFYAAGILLAAFAIVRTTGGFGNFHAPTTGWIAFLNVTKYPPSLAFIFLTLGVNLILLGIIDAGRGPADRGLGVFGRTPLFFYILHLYLYGLMGWIVPSGVSQVIMLFFWLTGLVMLYPLCRFYDRFKQAKPPETLWRLL